MKAEAEVKEFSQIKRVLHTHTEYSLVLNCRISEYKCHSLVCTESITLSKRNVPLNNTHAPQTKHNQTEKFALVPQKYRSCFCC
jgi:ribulose-5-phosphate 4-epimerase/fuculose-1-phosphate aldolase